MKFEKEINHLKEVGFIYEIEHTQRVLLVVVVPKKNGKLRVCVNLKKVNAATIRDHYPLPIMDHILERVVGASAYSFLDGFFGYNQLFIVLRINTKWQLLLMNKAHFPTRLCLLGWPTLIGSWVTSLENSSIFFGSLCWWFVCLLPTKEWSLISTLSYIWEVLCV